MSIFRFIYKSIGKATRIIIHIIDTFRTWWKFFCLCDEFHGFLTFGTPFVNVSEKKGSRIVIGENLRLNNGMQNNQIGYGETPCTLIADGGSIIIGNNVGMSQTTLRSFNGAQIVIGDNTILGGGVKIYTTDFHSMDYRIRREPLIENSIVQSKSIIIGRDCFIGAGSIILKGVAIGDRSVVGAGSVVCKDIPSDCIAVGNPCRIIKRIQEELKGS